MASNKQAEYDRKDRERLKKAIDKVEKLIQSNSIILVLQCGVVGSFHLQKIRKILRGEADIVRGKVAHLRTAIQHQLSAHPKLKPLLQYIRGEIGLLFTNMDILYIKTKIESEITFTGARFNSRAANDIIIPEGLTILNAGADYSFSILNIPTKVLREKIYICNDCLLYKKGDLIDMYGFKLLRGLMMKPIITQVKVLYAYYNGHIDDEKNLNEAQQRVDKSLHDGIQNVASISVAIGAANKSSMMYILHSGLRNVRAVSLGMEETRTELFSNQSVEK